MIGWVDAGAGAAGDMLLAAAVGAGADVEVVRAAVQAVAPEPIALTVERTTRGGIGALRADVQVADSSTHRGLGAVLALIDQAELPDDVRQHAQAVFALLGAAEARIHGVSTDDLHFHEVGALDSIADVVGVCAALVQLDLAELHCGPVAVGSGTVATSHGQLTVPPPAVVELLRGRPTFAGPAAAELCTPTGAALLRHWVTTWGPQPAMIVDRVGTGAGSRDFASHPNAVRLLVGEPLPVAASAASYGGDSGTATVLETNVDDLDPRLWPTVLQRLLHAGASDAWLTPILMKKGRPAHTLSVLARADRVDDVRRVIFAETSAIGMRLLEVGKHALDREMTSVEVRGEPIAVKLARSDGGGVLSVQPEYDDVVAAAARLDLPVKVVLAAAIAAAADHWPS